MKIEERKAVRRLTKGKIHYIYNFLIHSNIENEAREKEEKRVKSLQARAKARHKSGSPFVRVEDLESNASKVQSAKKEKLDDDLLAASKEQPKQTVEQKEPKSIKKWDTQGKPGVKMEATT